MQRIVLSLLSVIFFSYAYAGWPVFPVPTSEQLKLFETSQGCKLGEVRIPSHTQIEIRNRYIPSNQHWYWYYQGNNNCFAENRLINYVGINQTSNEAPGLITAHYKSVNAETFNFIFHIPPLPWDCSYLINSNLPIYIGCAQDENSNKTN